MTTIDDLDIDYESVRDWIATTNDMPKTSVPVHGEYKKFANHLARELDFESKPGAVVMTADGKTAEGIEWSAVVRRSVRHGLDVRFRGLVDGKRYSQVMGLDLGIGGDGTTWEESRGGMHGDIQLKLSGEMSLQAENMSFYKIIKDQIAKDAFGPILNDCRREILGHLIGKSRDALAKRYEELLEIVDRKADSAIERDEARDTFERSEAGLPGHLANAIANKSVGEIAVYPDYFLHTVFGVLRLTPLGSDKGIAFKATNQRGDIDRVKRLTTDRGGGMITRDGKLSGCAFENDADIPACEAALKRSLSSFVRSKPWVMQRAEVSAAASAVVEKGIAHDNDLAKYDDVKTTVAQALDHYIRTKEVFDAYGPDDELAPDLPLGISIVADQDPEDPQEDAGNVPLW